MPAYTYIGTNLRGMSTEIGAYQRQILETNWTGQEIHIRSMPCVIYKDNGGYVFFTVLGSTFHFTASKVTLIQTDWGSLRLA